MKTKNINFKQLIPIFTVLLVIVVVVSALFIKYNTDIEAEKKEDEKIEETEKTEDKKTSTKKEKSFESFKPSYASNNTSDDSDNSNVFADSIHIDNKFYFRYTPFLDFLLEDKDDYTAFVECEILDVSSYVYCDPYSTKHFALLFVYIKNDFYGVLESNRKAWLPILLPFEYGCEGFDDKFAAFCMYLYSIDHALIYIEQPYFHDDFRIPVRDKEGNEAYSDNAVRTNIIGHHIRDKQIELEKFDIIPLRDQGDGELVVDLNSCIDALSEIDIELQLPDIKDFAFTDGMPAEKVVYKINRAYADIEYFSKWYREEMNSKKNKNN